MPMYTSLIASLEISSDKTSDLQIFLFLVLTAV